MRIVFVNPVATLGGAERVLWQCLSQLQRVPGFETGLLTFDDGELVQRARAAGIHTLVCQAPPSLASWGDSSARSSARAARLFRFAARALAAAPALADYLARLRQSIRSFHPHLIHSNGIKAHLLLSMVRPEGVPIVWHAHDFYSFRPLALNLLKLARRRARAAIAISRAVANDVERCLPGLKTEVIRNTVDCEQFCPGAAQGERLDQLAGLPPADAGVVRVGLVAAFARWKGHGSFLRAAAQTLKGGGGHYRFYIIGGPIYQTSAQFSVDELRTVARELGITESVAFVPFQSDPAFVYRSLDIVVHASELPEPFGLTIAEAMSCGRAVIVSRAGGAAELFEPNQDAIGVPLADIPALASAIVELASDPARRDRLGLAARERAVREFGPDRLGAQLSRFYRRLTQA